ncbi:DUF4157 domain-containing protein [Lentzea sp. NPDC051208]|uniref:eCIS core domain-containing protein n=1 Tax=Lentzea sp. NPDC051208 TaxID=3154642 RepID=UPI00341459F7
MIAQWVHPALQENLRGTGSMLDTPVASAAPDPDHSRADETPTPLSHDLRRVTAADLVHHPVEAENAELVLNAPQGPRVPLRHRLLRVVRRTTPHDEPATDVPGATSAGTPPHDPMNTPGPEVRRRLEPIASSRVPDALTRHVVPGAVAQEFRQLHGVDISAVPVLRGPLAGKFARALGARAVTHQGAVFLPDEAGPLDGRAASSLLAHELVHHVQQTQRTATVDESTPDGRRMEQVAVSTERWFRGNRMPMAHVRFPAGKPASPTMREDLSSYVHDIVEQAAGEAHDRVLADTQRASITAGEPTTIPELGMNTSTADSAGDGVTGVDHLGLSPSAVESLRRGEPVLVRAAAHGLPGVAETLEDVRRAAELPTDSPLLSQQTEAELRQTLRELREADRSAVDLNNPRQLDELARRLYERILGSLRHELLVDRERAGLLADFR